MRIKKGKVMRISGESLEKAIAQLRKCESTVLFEQGLYSCLTGRRWQGSNQGDVQQPILKSHTFLNYVFQQM